MLEIAQRESRHHDVERTVGKRQTFAVFTHKPYALGKSRLSHLGAADRHHSFRDVAANDFARTKTPARIDGQIARAGSHIKDAHLSVAIATMCPHVGSSCPLATGTKQLLDLIDGTATPPAVDAERQRMVQPIIRGGNVVKHRLHLFMLRAFPAVGLYLFDSHSVTFFSMRAAMSSHDSSFWNFSPVICS